jgi:hypothetical protein
MTQPLTTGFQFEHTTRFTEAEYVHLRRIGPILSRRGRVKFLLALLLGAGLIAFRWTAPLGGFLVLTLVGFSLLLRFGPKFGRDEYRRSSYMHGDITYGVAGWGIWIEAGPLRAESMWAGVQTWHSRDGMLMLAAAGMPPVYLPEAQLREAGLYDKVMALAREYAAEFDTPEARRRFNTPVA